jgi:hypothetical protein
MMWRPERSQPHNKQAPRAVVGRVASLCRLLGGRRMLAAARAEQGPLGKLRRHNAADAAQAAYHQHGKGNNLVTYKHAIYPLGS